MTDESNRVPSRGAPVPSMEDIMTSIRRMIVNEPEAPAAPMPSPRPTNMSLLKQDEDFSLPQFGREPRETQPGTRQDVDGAPFEAGIARADGPAPTSDHPPNAHPEPARPMPAPAAAWRDSHDLPAPSFKPGPAMPGPFPVAASNDEDKSHAAIPGEAPEQGDQGLLSSAAAQVGSHAFARLAEAANRQAQSTTPRPRAPSIDELVAEMMRPMLKDWLDNNLPQIVERIVETEVARLVKSSGR